MCGCEIFKNPRAIEIWHLIDVAVEIEIETETETETETEPEAEPEIEIGMHESKQPFAQSALPSFRRSPSSALSIYPVSFPLRWDLVHSHPGA